MSIFDLKPINKKFNSKKRYNKIFYKILNRDFFFENKSYLVIDLFTII